MGTCQSCARTDQCPDGVCDNGQCRLCANNNECVNGQSCLNGKCGSCSGDSECTGSGKCSKRGICEGGHCAGNPDCPGGQVCIQGACAPCANNNQCASGLVCSKGVCGLCTANEQCPAGLICASNGICIFQTCAHDPCCHWTEAGECTAAAVIVSCSAPDCNKGPCKNPQEAPCGKNRAQSQQPVNALMSKGG